MGVSRGGLVFTRLISDLLDIQDVAITRCEYYSDVGKTRRKPLITQKIQKDLRRKHVLLVDDVSDTGESLKEIIRYIREEKKPASLGVATLYIKPWSIIVPDYYAESTDAWIIFPWELYEAIKLLTKRNERAGLGSVKIPKTIFRRLERLDAISQEQTSRK